MKNYRCIVLGLLLLFAGLSSSGQWQKAGPDGGIVYDVVVNGSDWICRTNGGIYKSTDNGDNWTDVTNGLPYGPTISIILHAGEYYLSTKSGGLYTSTDGNSWTLKNNGLFKWTYSDGTKLYGVNWPTASTLIATTNDGSSFGGMSTISNPTGPVVANGSNLFAGTTGGVRYYTGSTWASFAASGLGSTNDLKYFPAGLFAASSTGIFIHSGNLPDNNWTLVSNGLPASTDFSCLAYSNSKYFAIGKLNGIYTLYSSSDGTNWVSTFNFDKNKVFSLRASGSTLIACTARGLYISTDDGQTWTLKVSNIKAHYITDIKGTSSALYASVCYKDFMTSTATTYVLGGAIFKSTDNGLTWTKTGINDTLGVVGLLVVQDKIFAICQPHNTVGNDNRVFRSTDGGDNWSPLPDETKYATSIVYYNNALFLAGLLDASYQYSIGRSTDFGDNWTLSATGYTSTTSMSNLISTSNTLFISNGQYFSASGGIYKSTDDGANWSTINNSYQQGFQSNGPINKISTDGSVLYASIFHYFISNAAEYYYSIDNGQHWQLISAGLPQHKLNCYHSWEGNTYFGTGLDGGYYGTVGTIADSGSVYMTSDQGVTWTDLSGDLPEITVNALHVSGDKLFAGTFGAGIWMREAISGNITQPAALSTFNPGSDVLLQWEVENVNNVILEYSDNGGSTWNAIVTNLPSNNLKINVTTNGQYSWNVPSISASQIQVRLKDYDTEVELKRATYNISTSPTSLSDPQSFQMKIYPNPSSGIFIVDGNNQYQLEVINSLGKQVYYDSINGSQLLDLSGLPRGIYSCRLLQGDQNFSIKLIIE